MPREVYNAKTGQWTPGKAGPELLPDHMRGLPSEITTKEDAEADKVHALDPPHVVRALVKDHARAELRDLAGETKVTASELAELADAPVGAVVPLNQERIDVARMKAAKAILDDMADGRRKPDFDGRWHLWFPEDNVNHRTIVAGNAPPDSERPAHLRGYLLWVDPFCWPRSITDKLEKHGLACPDMMTRLEANRAARDMEGAA
jgi:hypothetical protein